jgi:lipopolysaccharide transport system ATP-binding protein
MSLSIEVKNLSKAYQLGQFSTGTISRDIERWWALFRGKNDPFLKIGEVNDRTKKSSSNIVWSLKDLNFEIQQGDTVGIIGKNGAGKSTLLKILSQVTSPTSGTIKLNGRVSSLLEVGTGFHPELTGRENVYLNGAILGMRKNEIKRKFDEIVDFSGVEKYIDTPVKRYSSGMQLRLAFAVAAYLESEILIVDEVLAVGDADFQKKCLGKMGDISKGDGRTILFVSHNMPAVTTLCKKGILLENGMLKSTGLVNDVIADYSSNKGLLRNHTILNLTKNEFTLTEIYVKSKEKDLTDIIIRDEEIELHIFYENNSNSKIHFNLLIKNEEGQIIITTNSLGFPNLIKAGKQHSIMTIPAKFFNDNTYFIDFYVVENGTSPFIVENDILSFSILTEALPLGAWMGKEPGYVRLPFDWK